MKYLDLSFQTPEENLACDEALLEHSEEHSGPEILRFWEPTNHFVVLGFSRKVNLEVNLESCAKRNIPILRRSSGGGTVLQGPGCLNYSLILNIQDSRPIQSITETNQYVLRLHKESLEPILGKPVQMKGISDLTLEDLKFSGNAQRRKKSFLLFHGTFLLNFKIPLIEEVLTLPLSQPKYRQNRKHQEFLTNLNVSGDVIKDALLKTWRAENALESVPRERIAQLAKERYSDSGWNLKF